MKNTRSALLGLAAALSLVSCGLSGSGGDGASVDAQSDDLAGASLAVGSKDFDESIILGEMTKFLLQAAGAEVTEKLNIAGSTNARRALTSGDIDIYWDYTGSGWIEYLGNTEPIADPVAQYEAVRDEDLEQNGLVWSAPAPMNNTFAIAVKDTYAEEHDLSTLSDVKELLAEDEVAGTLCTESEFTARDDGLPGLEEKYDFSFSDVSKMSPGVAYAELEKGNCNFGVVFATDGRIDALDLTVLEDDAGFFPVYNAAAVLREETHQEYPYIGEAMDELAALLTDEVMQELNARVSADGEPADQVARDFLESNDLLDGE